MHKWFLHKISKDLFITAMITWLVLFVLETVKVGIVSNYLSLSHLAVVLFFLGVIAVIGQPGQLASTEQKLEKSDFWVLLFFSLLMIVLIPLLVDASIALTIILIFVTVSTLCLGSLSMD